MYYYNAYGLNICSAIYLPELIQIEETKADVVIHFNKIDRSLLKPFRWGINLHITQEEVTFFWDEVGAMLVRDGKEIIIDPLPDVEESLIHLPLLGMVFAVMLHQRGFLTLHASAAEINGGAAIFLGGSGWGKSTLAATLYSRGHQLISDDLVAINFDNMGNLIIIPAFPQLKLLPEAAAFALGDNPETLPRLAKDYEKRARRGINRFSQKPVPIKGIYQLAKGSELALKPLNPQQATMQLIANSFVGRCASPLLEAESGISHFHKCMSLIKHVPIYRLERPQSLELVSAIAELIEENLGFSKQIA